MLNTAFALNELSAAWKGAYDVTSSVRLRFWAGENQKLYLNDTEVCSGAVRKIAYAHVVARHIAVRFEDLSSLHVFFSWPEDEPPHISSILFHPS